MAVYLSAGCQACRVYGEARGRGGPRFVVAFTAEHESHGEVVTWDDCGPFYEDDAGDLIEDWQGFIGLNEPARVIFAGKESCRELEDDERAALIEKHEGHPDMPPWELCPNCGGDDHASCSRPAR